AAECGVCHKAILESYLRTGMGRSFSAVHSTEPVADFYHPASDTHFAMTERGGRVYQHSSAGSGASEELSADYVLGSGNHARTYLHRDASGALIQLPLGWYSEKGGYW